MLSFLRREMLWRQGTELHINIDCICNFAFSLDELEKHERKLKMLFNTDKIVFHHLFRKECEAAVIEVESGSKKPIDHLLGAYKGDRWCGTYPLIKGLGMEWKFKE
jgi:hypothetical protein